MFITRPFHQGLLTTDPAPRAMRGLAIDVAAANGGARFGAEERTGTSPGGHG